jgi:hypothetical protein
MQPKVGSAQKSVVPMSFGSAQAAASRSSAPAAVASASSAPAAAAPASSASPGVSPGAAYIASAQAAAAPAGSGRTGPYVGAAFTPSEIQTLMSHAGSGCPMGPCKGCPHHEVTTGSCKA